MNIPVYKLDGNRKRVYYTYVLELGYGKYYVGQTANLAKRFEEHEENLGARETRKNPPESLAYYETYLTRKQAKNREQSLKRLSPSQMESIFNNRKGEYKMLKKKKKSPAGKPARRKAKRKATPRKRNAPLQRKGAVSRKRRANPRVTYRRRKAKWTANRPSNYSKRKRKYSRRRNPGMSYKRRRYTRRRNPGMPKMFRFLNRRFLTRSASFGGGLAAGYVTMPLYVRFLPAPFTANYRRFYGALNLLLGGLIFTASKRGAGRNIGSAIAGTGVYDLVAKLFPDLGLPALPNSSALIEEMMPEDTDTDTGGVSANFNPALMGANYEPRGLSANYEPESTGLGANYTPALFGGCGSPDGGM